MSKTKSTKKRLLTIPRLIILGLILFLGLMGLWFFLRDTLVRGLVQGIETLEAEGYQIGHGGLSVSGFPFSLSAQTQNISIKAPTGPTEDPGKNWTIRADQLALKTATLYPLAWTLTHSGNLRVDMRGPRGERYMFDVMPANIQARIAASIKGHLKSAHLQMSRTQLDALIGTPPILSKLAGLEAGLDVHGGIGDFDLRMDDLLLSPKTPGPVDDILGRKISTVSIKGQLENWITLEREGAQAWAEKNSHIRATGWQMLWGPADMIGDFDFTIKNGLPEGVIHIRIKHADALIDKIAQAGQMQASDSQKAKGFLKLIRPDADGRKPIELTIRDGVLRYGFIPLANLKD